MTDQTPTPPMIPEGRKAKKSQTAQATGTIDKMTGSSDTPAIVPYSGTATRWEYRSQGVHLGEKMLGKTKVSSGGEIASLAEAMNTLGAQGWELVSVAPTIVVGKIRKSADRREVTVAYFKRPIAS